MAFNKKLMEILVCPKCKGELQLRQAEDGLTCAACKLEYPINDKGIPCMIIDEAKPLPE